MKKIKILVLTLVLLILTGCGNKEALTSKDFKNIVRDNELYVIDSKEQFSEYDYIKESFVAVKSNEYQIEFYILEDDENAKAFYDYNKQIFEARKTNNSIYTSIDLDTNNKYTLTTEDKYMVISRVKDTVLYVDVNKEYKDEVNKLIKKLGY